MSEQKSTVEILAQLTAPFAADEIEWKPMVVSGSRAMAAAYIDARAVMNRLDAVLGAANWQDDYEVLEGGSALCRLRIRLGGEWIQKADVGSESGQKDPGDRRKASISDALKRAAVKFGVGRYLYQLPSQWVDYDPQKKQFTRTPQLPAWALPGSKPAPARPAAAKQSPRKPAGLELPATGDELCQIVDALDAELSRAGFPPGELFAQVQAWLKEKTGGAVALIEQCPPEKFGAVLTYAEKYLQHNLAKSPKRAS